MTGRKLGLGGTVHSFLSYATVVEVNTSASVNAERDTEGGANALDGIWAAMTNGEDVAATRPASVEAAGQTR